MTALLPHPACFWIVEGKLLAGNYPFDKQVRPGRAKLRALVDAGVTLFVDLTRAADGLRPYEAELERVAPLIPRAHTPIRDMGVPESRAQMSRILDLLDAEIGRGWLVYLHCWGGHGRTNTVAGCWLRRHGRDAPAALAELQQLHDRYASRQWRSDGPQTRAQRDYIRAWTE